MFRRLIVSIVLVCVSVTLLGQATRLAPATAPALEPLRLYLMDGSLVTGKLSVSELVVTTSFSIVGHIATTGFAVTNSYGTLQLKLADIRRGLRTSAEPDELKKTISVAGTLISTRAFEPGLRVNKGDQVFVTASGTITM